ncbi:MAG: serine--tRNA ligase [Defluviitaleaceae bacterium]|nr:serine--tRNA ligase [Defluviitaleaceae bacterium]
MLDIKILRNDFERAKAMMARRGKPELDLAPFLAMDAEHRALITETDNLKAEQNTTSKKVPIMKKNGEDTTAVLAEMKTLSDKIAANDEKLREIAAKLEEFLLGFPNFPSEQVADGTDATDNTEIRRHLAPRSFDFKPLAHWDVGKNLDILDFEMGGRVTGSRFTFCKGLGARLERALINFMLDYHTTHHGYTEIFPPFIANRSSMQGTGQLPKFEEDMFKLEGLDYFLVPTAEVPITNMYKDTILEGDRLPISYTAYSACFRAEAGSAGRDTRGLIRQHQFNKVELVKFTRPEDSYAELEKLTSHAEEILKQLELPYRAMRLCAGDIGFSSAMTYDLEVWMPSYENYVEISSCSNFEDFQARRAGIRYKAAAGEKAAHVHTLNGSGLAIGRTVAAILENFQNADGSVSVPKVLVPYMGTSVIECLKSKLS